MPSRLYLPPEFAPHSGCWLLWPERPDNWRKDAAPAGSDLAALAHAISRFEPVTVGVKQPLVEMARRQLGDHIRVIGADYDDIWIRDTGPLCARDENGHLIALDWQFNSWGGLFASWEKDNEVARQVAKFESIDCQSIDTVLEGGAIVVDGDGTLIATEECLLSATRNPGLSKLDYERLFRTYFGIDKVIWLPAGLAGDETGGHVDNLCAFVNPGMVLLAHTDDPEDPNYHRTNEALDLLMTTSDAQGRSITVVKLPLPSPAFITEEESAGFAPSDGKISRKAGDPLAASYINFYLANGALMAPRFDDPADAIAFEILGASFPSREVVPVNAREFLLGGGGPHCVTLQIPVRK